MDLRRIILILRQRLWLLVALSLGLLALFLLIPKLGEKVVYVSAAKILLTPSQRAYFGPEGQRGMESGQWLAEEQTLRELLTSERLLSRVAQLCGVRSPWQELRDQVTVEPLSYDYGRRVNLFALSIQDASPKQAQKLTQAAVNEFTTYVEELSAREFANTRRFLEELVSEAKERVDDAEEKLLEITTAHADAKQAEAIGNNLMTLDTDKRKLQQEIAELDAEVSSVQNFVTGASSLLPSALAQRSGSLQQMEGALATARLRLVELEQLYTDENVQVVEQRAKLAKLERLYQSKVGEFAASVSQEKSQSLAQKRKQLQSIEARIQEVRNQQLSPSEKRQVAKLERQLNMWEENHLSLVKQLYQARVVEQSSRRQGAISVLESPGLGVLARRKKTRTLGAQIALGLPFCLSFAIVTVIALDLVGSSLRLLPRVESALGVPVMAVIPPVDDELRATWEAYKREDTLPSEIMSLLDDEAEPEPPVRLAAG